MSERDFQDDMQRLSQLRDAFEEEQETAVIAPRLKLSQRIRLQMGSYGTNKRIRTLIVRGLLLFMGLIVAGQLTMRGIAAVNNTEPGPIPLTAAIEQVEDDLRPPPPPPPPAS